MSKQQAESFFFSSSFHSTPGQGELDHGGGRGEAGTAGWGNREPIGERVYMGICVTRSIVARPALVSLVSLVSLFSSALQLVVAMSSDRGLCGGIHSGLCKNIRKNLATLPAVRIPWIVKKKKKKKMCRWARKGRVQERPTTYHATTNHNAHSATPRFRRRMSKLWPLATSRAAS